MDRALRHDSRVRVALRLAQAVPAIEKGNPTDSKRFMPMLERHIKNFGVVPKQIAADGGYAAKDNLPAAQKAQVKDVAFHKKRGWPSKTWSKASGCIASYVTSVPVSRPEFRA